MIWQRYQGTFSVKFWILWLFWKKFEVFWGFLAISLNFLLAFSKSQQFRPIFSRGTKYRNSGKNYVWKTVFGEIFWHFNFYPVLQFFPEIQVRLIPDLRKKLVKKIIHEATVKKNFWVIKFWRILDFKVKIQDDLTSLRFVLIENFKVSKSDFSRQIEESQNKSFKIWFFSSNRCESKQKFQNLIFLVKSKRVKTKVSKSDFSRQIEVS